MNMPSPGFEQTQDFSGVFLKSQSFCAARFIRDGSMNYSAVRAELPQLRQRIRMPFRNRLAKLQPSLLPAGKQSRTLRKRQPQLSITKKFPAGNWTAAGSNWTGCHEVRSSHLGQNAHGGTGARSEER